MTPRFIYIDWDGPYSFDELDELDDRSSDYGIYQVYGNHPLYGEEVLLYLGTTDEGTFAHKLRAEREYWEAEPEFHPLSLYVGRLAGLSTPSGEVWAQEIDLAARLLIYAHAPAFNGREVGANPDPDLADLHLINWGNYRDLAPEVSGARWLYKFEDLPSYNIYGRHGESH